MTADQLVVWAASLVLVYELAVRVVLPLLRRARRRPRPGRVTAALAPYATRWDKHIADDLRIAGPREQP